MKAGKLLFLVATKADALLFLLSVALATIVATEPVRWHYQCKANAEIKQGIKSMQGQLEMQRCACEDSLTPEDLAGACNR